MKKKRLVFIAVLCIIVSIVMFSIQTSMVNKENERISNQIAVLDENFKEFDLETEVYITEGYISKNSLSQFSETRTQFEYALVDRDVDGAKALFDTYVANVNEYIQAEVNQKFVSLLASFDELKASYDIELKANELENIMALDIQVEDLKTISAPTAENVDALKIIISDLSDEIVSAQARYDEENNIIRSLRQQNNALRAENNALKR